MPREKKKEPVEKKVEKVTKVTKEETGESKPLRRPAVSELRPEASEQKEKASEPKTSKTKARPKKKKGHSKGYLDKAGLVDSGKLYKLEEAIGLAKKVSYSKFDGTVSLAIRIAKSKKTDESIRGTIRLPHGTGKKVKVAVASEELIEEIKKGKTDFDLLVATPEMMPRLAQVAKILGPKGKMPNPKDGTVVDDPQAHLEELGERIVRFRADAHRNVHIPVGRVSWADEKLLENIQAALKTLASEKKLSVTLSPTMGPGVGMEVK